MRESLDEPNPSGLCMCGCGQPTPLAPKSDKYRGIVKGKPQKYIPGHHRRSSPLEYIEEDRGYLTPCWMWQRHCNESGYGMVGSKKHRSKLAHRVFYERKHGPIPDGLVPDHLCRQPPCVNPDHLELVTQAVNSQRGAMAKATPEIVREIRALAPTTPVRTLCEMFGMSDRGIRNIISGTRWKNVT